jgi:hypothetical protein
MAVDPLAVYLQTVCHLIGREQLVLLALRLHQPSQKRRDQCGDFVAGNV